MNRHDQSAEHTTQSPQENEQKSLITREINFCNRTIILVSVDHTQPDEYSQHAEEINKQIAESNIVFVEYFPPEIMRNIPLLKLIKNNQIVSESGIMEFFKEVTESAARQGKQVAVADIANRVLYEAYESVPLTLGMTPLTLKLGSVPLSDLLTSLSAVDVLSVFYSVATVCQLPGMDRGVRGDKISIIEKLIPYATDARRQLTATGIMQEALRYKEGSKIVYFSAEAHNARVDKYIRKGFDITDKLRNLFYRSMIGLDKSVRVYKSLKDQPDEWIKVSEIAL